MESVVLPPPTDEPACARVLAAATDSGSVKLVVDLSPPIGLGIVSVAVESADWG